MTLDEILAMQSLPHFLLSPTVSIPEITCKRHSASERSGRGKQIFDLAMVKTYHALDLAPGNAGKLAGHACLGSS
jgi:hypothetical protein